MSFILEQKMRQHEKQSENLKNRTSEVDVDWLKAYYTYSSFSLKDLEKTYEKTEDDIKAVQSVGQIIGEVMKQLDDDRCTWLSIVFV